MAVFYFSAVAFLSVCPGVVGGKHTDGVEHALTLSDAPGRPALHGPFPSVPAHAVGALRPDAVRAALRLSDSVPALQQ